ncbi:unnamed protein product [Effrenium voratum]|uniref:Citrate transporter-like domain-containing protein n=1 Tax=Effrenium voratum TaxID=2562239 RepID=A0AA36NDZ3_9DINO|nr:unnamed protein product [Effrenium voratum]
MCSCALTDAFIRPSCMAGNPDFRYPVEAAYGTLLALVFGLTHLLNGVRSSFVFTGYLVVLAVFGLVDQVDILRGFARVGPWLPQLQLVIIRGIRDSGILQFSLLWMLGRNPKQGSLPRVRLYCATLCLGALVGGSTTIATSTPVIIQWAKSHDFKLRPLLLMMVVAATCGNSVFVTSNPASIAVRDLMRTGRPDLELHAQTPLALANAAVLGLYAVFMGDYLSRKDGNPKPEAARRRNQPWLEVELEETGGRAEPPEKQLYEIDFTVVRGSLICGHTPRSAGLMNLSNVRVLRVSRLLSNDGAPCCSSASGHDMEDWCIDVGDLITARCSAAGVCAMRSHHGVFAMRGLRCNRFLGGRRHDRRLYESVVASASGLVGKSLEEILGIPPEGDESECAIPWCVRVFRGYPLAAWRPQEQAQPLSPRDPLCAGDVVLIDAFEEFPSLQTARRHFVISGLVPKSQAPRHGRPMDMWRGVLAVLSLILALILDLFKRCHILVSMMLIAGMLFITSGVKWDQIPEILDWNSCITIGCGEGVAIAVRRSGLQNALAKLIFMIGNVGGTPLQLCVLSFLAQSASACISATPAGLLVANAALALDADFHNLDSEQTLLLVVISVNMVLTVQMPDELMSRSKRTFSVRHLFLWLVPTGVLVAAMTVAYILLVSANFSHYR